MNTSSAVSCTETDPVLGDGFMSVAEAAQFLRLSRAKLYLLMDAGQISFARFGRARRVPKRAIMEFARSCLVR
jgi:excisionase family DNA binding protein